ncbi:hypothetical protein PsYK624_152980 [Phanerochaete sordida]|uniref:Heterokaryon incompatibility domain-containing protein n=1 Tax=Phanerochaete sordida TaxID=48140 RepID=A0A9P3LKW7_9APHY|nr:hypothetical protein PsYK624_152980 [Phanerochaete sordida]
MDDGHLTAINLTLNDDGLLCTECEFSFRLTYSLNLGIDLAGEAQSAAHDPYAPIEIRLRLNGGGPAGTTLTITADRPPWPAHQHQLQDLDTRRRANTRAEVLRRHWDTSDVRHVNGVHILDVPVGIMSSNAYRRTSEFRDAVSARMRMWAIIKLAEHGVEEEMLFSVRARRPKGERAPYVIVPGPLPGQGSSERSPVPYQRVHYSTLALPSELADRPCVDLDVDTLLATLNDIMGTDYTVDRPGLRHCLEHFLHTSQDFGQVYGALRRYWTDDLSILLDTLSRQKADDDAMRRDAVQGNYLRDSHVAPRRVWDLYSNRVLPFHVLPPASGKQPPDRFWPGTLYSNRVLPFHALPPTSGGELPDNLWTVSHSWVAADARASLITPINGREWPVPVPCATTLDHVRVELLNFGAEYVWLDILCLRQEGRAEDEPRRLKEWRLDIPTIGYIYSFPNTPCITYFNGLGLPFDPKPHVLASDRHCFNRVWTVQEATESWLPGGTTGRVDADTRRFFTEHFQQVILARPRTIAQTTGAAWLFYKPMWSNNKYLASLQRLVAAADMLQKRHCTTELDRVASLAYIIGCETLPLYDTTVSVEIAWAILLKHLPAHLRGQIALRHMETQPERDTILPSWVEFLEYFPRWNVDGVRPSDIEDNLLHVHQHGLGTAGTGSYHEYTSLIGPCIIIQQPDDIANGTATMYCSRGYSWIPTFFWSRHRLYQVVGGPFTSDAWYLLRRTRTNVTGILRIVETDTVDGSLISAVERCGAVLSPDGSLDNIGLRTVHVLYQR